RCCFALHGSYLSLACAQGAVVRRPAGEPARRSFLSIRLIQLDSTLDLRFTSQDLSGATLVMRSHSTTTLGFNRSPQFSSPKRGKMRATHAVHTRKIASCLLTLLLLASVAAAKTNRVTIVTLTYLGTDQ